MQEYLLLIREPENLELTPKAMEEDIQAHMRWVAHLIEKGQFREGNPLASQGFVMKGNQRIQGPLIEANECITGYFILLAENLQEACAIAEGCPSLKQGATLEIREIQLME
jgi:hypothetical protein